VVEKGTIEFIAQGFVLMFNSNYRHDTPQFTNVTNQPTTSRLEMHDEIFHFEIFKNFMKILKHFKTPF